MTLKSDESRVAWLKYKYDEKFPGYGVDGGCWVYTFFRVLCVMDNYVGSLRIFQTFYDVSYLWVWKVFDAFD